MDPTITWALSKYMDAANEERAQFDQLANVLDKMSIGDLWLCRDYIPTNSRLYDHWAGLVGDQHASTSLG